MAGRRKRTSSDSQLPALPYLREVSLRTDTSISFNEYPFRIPAIRNLNTLQLAPDVTFLVGENGTGKSTLLEAIAVALGMNPEGGGRNFNFATHESHSPLWRALKVVRSWSRPRDQYFLRAESYFNVATEIERLDAEPEGGPPIIDAYGGIGLHEQSHGESFFALLMHRFKGRGLYLLDEPEAALSPQRQIQMLGRIRQLVQQDSQFIISTHSPILMAYPNARILVLDQNGYTETPYTATAHYRLYKDFLDNPEDGIRQAFAPHH